MMRLCLPAMVAAIALCPAGAGIAQDIVANTPPPSIAARNGDAGTQTIVVATDAPAAGSAPVVQTLQEALVRTYRTSPALMAERAAVRGLDSGAALERAQAHPQLSTGARFGQEVVTSRRRGSVGRDFTASADVEQVLFAGGRIRNAVSAADTRVIAGRADLRAVEGEVLSEAVEVYADLVRDRAIRDLTLDQVRVLEANLRSTRSRLNVGDLTRTDVSQSEARLALAQSSLAVAEGRLQTSEENFQRVVGSRAGILKPLPALPPMPQTIEQAVDITLDDNANVAALASLARAADYDVAATRANRLPTVSAVGSTAYTNALGTANRSNGLPPGTLPNSETNVIAGLSVRLPLYQGGGASARVRQAEEARTMLVEQAIQVERLAVADARAAYATWRNALLAIAANRAAIEANEVALRSVRIEQSVGSRSIIEVLNAEQELLASRISLASAERDAYVAAFGLLNAMGAAEAADLGIGADDLYDPGANYRQYGRSWSDWADGPRRSPAATRTVPGDAEGPVTRLATDTPTSGELHP
jgi:outer membrane protein